MTSGGFLESLAAAARKNKKRIVLPEFARREVLGAAARAQRDGIADCVLLGAPAEINAAAAAHNITLPDSITATLAPVAALAPPLAVLRARRGLSAEEAAAWLHSAPFAAAAMMVREKYADGMVAGAGAASAEVLRPVLQILGAAEARASSFFLMDMPQGAKLFADCALNVRPSAEELAAIAAQSAESARRFGIIPAVALLSYATGDSAEGEDAARIGRAAEIARRNMPGVSVFGPAQYDAAVSPQIGARKAPQWKDAGCANVLVFPDLASGNIAYKAVQQAAGIAAVGPLLQGIAAPANDLSRGATEDDIYYTIAATAVQAGAAD